VLVKVDPGDGIRVSPQVESTKGSARAPEAVVMGELPGGS
jgi:hypothetical protein